MSYSIPDQFSFSIPPENTGKAMVFVICSGGVERKHCSEKS